MNIGFVIVTVAVAAYFLGVLTGRAIWGPPLEPPSDSE